MAHAPTNIAQPGAARIVGLGVLTLVLLVVVGLIIPGGVFFGPAVTMVVAIRALWLNRWWAWPVALTTVIYAAVVAIQIVVVSGGTVTTSS